MADAVQQQAKTKVITFSAGIELITDEYPVDFDQIKQLGFYSKDEFETLKDLFFATLDIFHRDGSAPYYELLKHQEIRLKVKRRSNLTEEGTLTELDTTHLRPDEPEFHGSKQSHLFFVDAVAILLGIARNLQNNFFPDYLKGDYLKEYSDPDTEDFYLKDWGQGQGKSYISQQALQRKKREIDSLATNIYQAIQEIEKNLEAEANGEEKPQEATTETKITEDEVDTIEKVIAKIAEDTQDPGGDGDQSTSQETPVDREDPQIQQQIEKSKSQLRTIAQTFLIDSIFEKSGVKLSELNIEAQNELLSIKSELLTLISQKIDAMVAAMPPEVLSEFITAENNGVARIKVLHKLLLELFSKSPQFVVLYQQFYEKQTDALIQLADTQTDAATSHNSIIQAQQTITALQDFIAEISAEAELAEIHAQVQTWKAQLIERYEQLELRRQQYEQAQTKTEQKSAKEETKPDKEPDFKEQTQAKSDQDSADGDQFTTTLSENDLPEAPVVLEVTQLDKLTTVFRQKNIPQVEDRILQQQSGRIVWGAMAQLFPEDAVLKRAIPAELFENVNTAAVEYLSNLSPAELTKLAKSPSSLIRHIRNITTRIQNDPVFAVQYQKFSQTEGQPIINRTERIEIETQWALENAKYELFTSHHITTDLLLQSESLQKEYIETEHVLEIKVYSYILGLSNEELLELYLNPQKRTELFAQITHALNTDPKFKKELADLYTELLHFYEQQGLTTKKDELASELKITTNARLLTDEGGVRIIVDDVKHVDAAKLFTEQLKAELQIDSPIVLKAASDTLDSLILTYGEGGAIRMVQQLDSNLLGSMFQLPTKVNDTNYQTIREILINYAKVRSTNLSPSHGSVNTGFIPEPTEKITPQNVARHIAPMGTMSKMAADNGTEATTDATTGNIRKKAEVFDKLVGKEWNQLPLELKAAYHLLAGNPIPESLRDRIERNATNLDSDTLPPVFSILEYKGDRDLLLKAAITGKFRSLEFEQPGALQGPETPLTHAYKQMVTTQRLHNEIEYAKWNELEKEVKELIATQYQASIDEIEQQYILSIAGTPEQVVYTPSQLDDVERVAIGAGIAGGAVAAAAQSVAGMNQPARSISSSNFYSNALENVASGRIKQIAGVARGLKDGFKLAGAGARLAAGDLTSLGTLASTLWNNPELRRFLVSAGTLGISGLLYVLTHPMALASMLGSMWYMGLAGLAPGFAVGSAFSFAFPNIRIPGLSVRMPPNPFLYGSDAAEGSVSGSQTMAQMRAENGFNSSIARDSGANPQTATTTTSSGSGSPSPQTTAGRGAGGPQSTNPDGSPANPANAANSVYSPYSNPATATTTTTSLFSLAHIGLLVPLLTVIPVFILTIFTIVVISGAFLANTPTKPFNRPGATTPFGEQASSKYVDIKKTPSKDAIPNNTNETITYEITIAPKPGYSIKITEASDTFTTFGEGTDTFTSPFDVAQVPTEPITAQTAPITYSISTGLQLKDAFLMNAFSIKFDAMDTSGSIVETNQTYSAVASVIVGTPKFGCWPVSGSITSTPFMLSLPTHANTDAWDIGAGLGAPIHAPFPGLVNDKGFDRSGYGNLMTLKFVLPGDPLKQEREVFFGHLSGVADKFKGKSNQAVVVGEVIGYVGSTGNSTGPHLHYELYNNRDFAIDPGLGIRDIVPNGHNIGIGTRVTSCKPTQ